MKFCTVLNDCILWNFQLQVCTLIHQKKSYRIPCIKNLSLNSENSNDSSVLVSLRKNIYILNAGHYTYNKHDI